MNDPFTTFTPRTDREAFDAGDWNECVPAELARALERELAAARAEAAGWKLAAMQTGLYPTGTDVSTPELWHVAQLVAACKLIESAKTK